MLILHGCEYLFLFVYCRFNYRSTHHMSVHGFYEFLNWFDDRAWYPLGRIVGGTVSHYYLHFVYMYILSNATLVF